MSKIDFTNWEMKTIEEIAEKPQYGFTQSASTKPTDTKFLRITDIQDKSVDWETVPFCQCSQQELEKFELKVGDLFFARTGATTGKSYLLKDEPPKAVFASYLIRLRIKEGYLPEYVFHFFQSPDYWQQIRGEMRGAAQPNVNAQTLGGIKIPVPPTIEEQRFIVGRIKECLSRLDEIKHLREESRKDAESLEEAIFGDFLEDVQRDGCEVVNLGDVLTKAQYGTSAKATADGEGFPVLRMGNIKSGHFNFSDLKYMELSDAELEKYRLNVGDILINRTNSMELVGKSAVFQKEGDWVFASYLVRLVVDSSKAIPEFVNASINSRIGRAYVYATARRAIGMVNINAKEIAKMPLPLPSLEKQARIVSQIKEARTASQSLLEELEIKTIESLSNSILRKAFAGEL